MWIGTDLKYFGNIVNQIVVSDTNMYKNVTHIFCVFEFSSSSLFVIFSYKLYLDEIGF